MSISQGEKQPTPRYRTSKQLSKYRRMYIAPRCTGERNPDYRAESWLHQQNNPYCGVVLHYKEARHSIIISNQGRIYRKFQGSELQGSKSKRYKNSKRNFHPADIMRKSTDNYCDNLETEMGDYNCGQCCGINNMWDKQLWTQFYARGSKVGGVKWEEYSRC